MSLDFFVGFCDVLFRHTLPRFNFKLFDFIFWGKGGGGGGE